ncbi:alpha-(1,3)-fucosyltransferase fut-3-like [Pocillopora damicornis]|uniref:alpha-(1,3)-fucosyltransferase fut-3-like n=1 Tax=Pocillopora damicornis TaxID=46731 RepID=UPI000F558079|nr:alpha-(1,3)-fucosyltransferase fut-3-like [Pocillopora damicornis]
MGIARISGKILPLCYRKRSTLLVGMFLLLSFFSIIVLRNETSYILFEPWFCSNRTEIASDRSCFSNATKTILFYTPMFGSKPWPGTTSTKEYLLKCPTKKCNITYDIYDIGKSDLVIFHARDMPSYVRTKEIQQIHNYRCPQQRLAFLNQESIVNDPDLKNRLSLPEGFFNWTITFKRESDFPYPYGNYVSLPSAKRPARIPDYAAEKNKFVLWAVSNCGRTRDKYVKKLLKYIKVDVYGDCSENFGQDNQCQPSSNCDDIFSSYKFYLAFENSVCTDYITEKFWRTLGWNSVPITLTRDFYTPDVVPPGSFISVQDFPSVKALAEYLLYLDKNDTAYNEYFTWKREFVYTGILGLTHTACDICDALHNECVQPKFYKDIFKTFWNDNVDCKEKEGKLLQLIDREEK